MNEEQLVKEVLFTSKTIQLDIANGKLDFNDEMVQYFIPAIGALTDIDFLRLIAKNILVEEDCKVVMNFLDQFEALSKVNSQILNDAVADKLKDLFGGK